MEERRWSSYEHYLTHLDFGPIADQLPIREVADSDCFRSRCQWEKGKHNPDKELVGHRAEVFELPLQKKVDSYQPDMVEAIHTLYARGQSIMRESFNNDVDMTHQLLGAFEKLLSRQLDPDVTVLETIVTYIDKGLQGKLGARSLTAQEVAGVIQVGNDLFSLVGDKDFFRNVYHTLMVRSDLLRAHSRVRVPYALRAGGTPPR